MLEVDEFRKLGNSKDGKTGLVQMFIDLAVSRDGILIKSRVWPSNTPDMTVIEEVKNNLVG